PENIGALYRALLATPAVQTTRFNPFDEPPPFGGRREMIGMGETRLEDAYGTAIDALEGFPLFTLTQMLRLISSFGGFTTGDWSDKARHAVSKNARGEKPHHLSRKAGNLVRSHGGGPATLARCGYKVDRSGARSNGNTGRAPRRSQDRQLGGSRVRS